MASSEEFMHYVIGQLNGCGEIVYKKLFGEYGLWMDGKLFATVEENQFYIKITKSGQKLLPDAVPAAPHGGKPSMYLVEDLKDVEFLKELVQSTCIELPAPKPKKPKKKAD